MRFRSTIHGAVSRRGAIALALTGTLAVAGCGVDTADSRKDDPDWSTVTIEHAFGSTKIEAKPKRVVALGWSSQNVALALDVVPVGMPRSDWGGEKGVLPWTKEALGDTGTPTLIDDTDGIPVEKVASLKPDLILDLQSGMTKKEYSDLSKVAPTIPYLDKPWLTGWEEQTTTIGEALGREEKARKLVADVEGRLADIKKSHPDFSKRTFAFGYNGGGTLGFYPRDENRSRIMERLGFQLDPAVSRLKRKGDAPYAETSMEKASDIDADVLVMWYTTQDDRRRVEKKDLFTRIPAVKNGGYVGFKDTSLAMAMSAPDVLSLPWALDRFVPDLEKAAKGEA